MLNEKQKAKQIIREIIRQKGGNHDEFAISEAFYFVHLQFSAENNGVLSTWPILKGPNGAVPSQLKELLSELYSEDLPELSYQELKAIRNGQNLSSEPSKEVSHTWKESEIGDELAIYADLLTSEEIAQSKKTAEITKEIFLADEAKKTELFELMSGFSQYCWFASWSGDTEYALWKLATAGGGCLDQDCLDATGCGWRMDIDEAVKFLKLSGETGGWWIFDDKTYKNRFVTLKEWLILYKEKNEILS